MPCSNCGKSKSTASKQHKAPSMMRSGTNMFTFGPYGAKVAKTIIGRASPMKRYANKK